MHIVRRSVVSGGAPGDHALMNWIEIFRTGSHTDSAGRTKEWTAQDLDRIVESYDPAKHEAPLVLGHPKDNAPAYGWVSQLRRVGDVLQATFKDVHEEVQQLVADGRYKKRSISLYPDSRLRHVGLLGAVPPAVQGLRDIAGFGGGGESTCYEFEEGGMPTVEELQRKLDEAQAEIARLKAGGEFKEQLAARDAQITDLTAKLKDAEGSRDKAVKEFAEFRTGQDKQARQARLEKLVAEGKVLPAERDQVLLFAEALAEVKGEMEFSADGKPEKVSKEEAYWRSLEARQSNELLKEFTASSSGQQERTSVNLAAKF